MKYFYFVFLSLSFVLAGEHDSTATITVHATASVEVPADMVIFSVTIRAEKEEPQLAFDEHKELETKLLATISDFNIPDSNINYSLLNLRSSRKSRRTPSGDQEFYTYLTSQNVKVNFYNVESYLKFQVELLKNGFHQFSSSFSSRHFDGLKDAGYKKALKIAKENASIIVKNIGKKLGSIVNVVTETSDKFEFEQPKILRSVMYDRTTNLTDIKQTVSVITKLRVVYKIL